MEKKKEHKDNLKAFFETNKEDLNTYDAPSFEELFSPVKKKVFPFKIVSIAASIVFIVGLSMFLLPKEKIQNASVTPTEEIELQLSDISEENADVEMYYSQKINQKLSELNTDEIDDEVKEQLTELEVEYKTLQKELGSIGNNEVIVEAMIDNYRLKLMLLENLIKNLDIEQQNLTHNELKQDETYTIYY